jgi:hypothetical protein
MVNQQLCYFSTADSIDLSVSSRWATVFFTLLALLFTLFAALRTRTALVILVGEAIPFHPHNYTITIKSLSITVL